MYGKSEADYSYLGEPTLAMKLKRWGVVGVLVLYGVLLVVLLVMYGTHADEECSSCVSDAIGTFSSAIPASGSNVGMAASLSSGGVAQLGGGTSVYKDLYQLSNTCAKLPVINPLFDSSYVMTFIDGVNDSTNITVLKLSTARNMHMEYSVKYEKQIADMSAIDSKGGLFVAIAQDLSAVDDEAVVLTVLLDEENQAIHFGTEVVYGGQYSVNPQITPLSSDSFAITYLDNVTIGDGTWQYSAITKHGIIHSDHTISLSPPVIFASDANYELQSRVQGLNAESYLLVTNAATERSDEGFAYGPIAARVANVAVTEDGTSSVTLGIISSFPQKLAAFNMGSAGLDDATVLLAFSDYSNNFGITLITLKVSDTGSVSVAASYPFTSGQALSILEGDLQMDLDVATFSDNQFVLTYSDFSNSGALTMISGEVTKSGEIVRLSPDLLLSNESSTLGTSYQWHAMAALENSKPRDAEIAVVSSLQGANCDLALSGLSVSVMHILSSPIGAIYGATYDGADGYLKTDVQLSGVIGGYKRLIPGMMYFTNTFGEIFASGMYWGQQDMLCSSAGGPYAEDIASGTLMTGLVGVGISESTLLLKV